MNFKNFTYILFTLLFCNQTLAFDPSKLGEDLLKGLGDKLEVPGLPGAVKKQPSTPVEKKSEQPAKQTESQTPTEGTFIGPDGKIYREKFDMVLANYKDEECINLDTKPYLPDSLIPYTRDELKKIKVLFKGDKNPYGMDFTTMEYIEVNENKKETRTKMIWSPIKLIEQRYKEIQVPDSKINPKITKKVQVAQCFKANAAISIDGNPGYIIFYDGPKKLGSKAKFISVYGVFDNGDLVTQIDIDGGNRSATVISTSTASFAEYEADKKAKALKKTQSDAKAKNIRTSSRDNRGKWGLKFNMTEEEANKIKLPSGVMFGIEYVNSKGESFSDCGDEFVKGGKFETTGCKPDRVLYVSSIYKRMDNYTVAYWTKIFDNLNSKYKIVSKPNAQEKEKFMGSDGTTNPLVYLFENTKDPELAKYIIARVSGCFEPGLFCLKENQIFVGYVNSSVGDKILARRNKAQKEIDDL